MGLDIRTLEAAAAIYRVSGTEDEWVTSVSDALRPLLDDDLGMLGYRYRLLATGMSVEYARGIGLPRGLDSDALASATMRQPIDVSAKLYAEAAVSTASELGSACVHHVHEAAADYGVHDLHGLHVSDVDGGYVFATLAPRERRLTPATRRQFELIRSHVVAGVEQRRRSRALASAKLSPPERRVLELLAQGVSRREIAHELANAAPTGRALLHRTARKRGSRRVDHHFPEREANHGMCERLELAKRSWALTPRQVEVLRLLVRGDANKDIARELGCAENTVELHVTQLLKKSAASSRSRIIARFWSEL